MAAFAFLRSAFAACAFTITNIEITMSTTFTEAPMNGMRAAINMKCRDCIYDKCAPGTWRQQVEGCTIKSCSLWPYRPKSKTSTTTTTKETTSA
jgi:hypothetical protein